MYLIADSQRMGDKSAELPRLAPECFDDRKAYTDRMGNGIWIVDYMKRMENFAIQISKQIFARPAYFYDQVSQISFDNILDIRARALVIAFTNQYYLVWRSKYVKIPNYEVVRVQNRNYCFNCKEGWSCPFKRGLRPGERVFTCQTDCAEYTSIVANGVAFNLSADLAILDSWWELFRAAGTKQDLPAFDPIWLKRDRSINDVAAYHTAGIGITYISDLNPPNNPITHP